MFNIQKHKLVISSLQRHFFFGGQSPRQAQNGQNSFRRVEIEHKIKPLFE